MVQCLNSQTFGWYWTSAVRTSLEFQSALREVAQIRVEDRMRFELCMENNSQKRSHFFLFLRSGCHRMAYHGFPQMWPRPGPTPVVGKFVQRPVVSRSVALPCVAHKYQDECSNCTPQG